MPPRTIASRVEMWSHGAFSSPDSNKEIAKWVHAQGTQESGDGEYGAMFSCGPAGNAGSQYFRAQNKGLKLR